MPTDRKWTPAQRWLLMGAAEDLYEALEALLASHECTYGEMCECESVERARAALAKARGEQP